MIARETPPHRGRFITTQGSEGAGTTSDAQWLAAYLTILGRDGVRTRGAGGTWLGERQREFSRADEPKPAFERTIR